MPKPTKALEAREGDLGIERNLGRVMVVGAGGKGPGAGFYVSFERAVEGGGRKGEWADAWWSVFTRCRFGLSWNIPAGMSLGFLDGWIWSLSFSTISRWIIAYDIRR